MRKFKLPYHCSNNGDGSVSIHLHPSIEAASKADSEECEGWGEDCSGEKILVLNNNKLYYEQSEYNPKSKKYEITLIKIPEIKL